MVLCMLEVTPQEPVNEINLALHDSGLLDELGLYIEGCYAMQGKIFW